MIASIFFCWNVFKHIEMEQRQGQVFRWKIWQSTIVRIKFTVQVRNVFSILPCVASSCVIAVINGQQSDKDNRVPSLSPTVLVVMRHIAAVNSCLGVKCSTPGDLSVTTMTSAVNGHQFKRTWWGGDSRVSPTRTNPVHNCPHSAIIDMNYPLCKTSRILSYWIFLFLFSKSSETLHIFDGSSELLRLFYTHFGLHKPFMARILAVLL